MKTEIRKELISFIEWFKLDWEEIDWLDTNEIISIYQKEINSKALNESQSVSKNESKKENCFLN